MMTEIGNNGHFVDRGDPSNLDYSQSTLVANGAWHDMDFSPIVPQKATAVALRLGIVATTINAQILVRKKGNKNYVNIGYAVTQVANLYLQNDFIVPIGPDRIIEYLATESTWTTIHVSIKGWWI